MKKQVLIKCFLIVVVVVSTLGFVIGYLGSKGFFDPKGRSEKYCYIYYKDHSDKKSQSVIATNSAKFAKDILNYYQLLLHTQRKDTSIMFVMPEISFYVPIFLKVKVIGFNSDSTIVKVWAQWEGNARPIFNDEKALVPRIALHDTLPSSDK